MTSPVHHHHTSALAAAMMLEDKLNTSQSVQAQHRPLPSNTWSFDRTSPFMQHMLDNSSASTVTSTRNRPTSGASGGGGGNNSAASLGTLPRATTGEQTSDDSFDSREEEMLMVNNSVGGATRSVSRNNAPSAAVPATSPSAAAAPAQNHQTPTPVRMQRRYRHNPYSMTDPTVTVMTPVAAREGGSADNSAGTSPAPAGGSDNSNPAVSQSGVCAVDLAGNIKQTARQVLFPSSPVPSNTVLSASGSDSYTLAGARHLAPSPSPLPEDSAPATPANVGRTPSNAASMQQLQLQMQQQHVQFQQQMQEAMRGQQFANMRGAAPALAPHQIQGVPLHSGNPNKAYFVPAAAAAAAAPQPHFSHPGRPHHVVQFHQMMQNQQQQQQYQAALGGRTHPVVVTHHHHGGNGTNNISNGTNSASNPSTPINVVGYNNGRGSHNPSPMHGHHTSSGSYHSGATPNGNIPATNVLPLARRYVGGRPVVFQQ